MGIKLKIALVSQEYPPETARGGIGSQTFTKAHGLASLGHEIFVISRSVDNTRQVDKNENLTVIRIPGFEKQLPEMTDIVQWITHSTLVAAEIDALHKDVNLDILDFPEWAAEGYVHLLNQTAWNKIPSVIQLHGPLVMFNEVMGWPGSDTLFFMKGTDMEATCVQLADAVYSSSRCSAEWIRKHYNPGKENIPTIHLGIDTKLFSPKAVEKYKHPVIVFIGKLVRNKGLEELIDAALMIVNEFPRLQIRIIGRGEENFVSQLKTKAASFGADGLLDFAGFVHQEDLPVELSKAHLFAVPSHYEGGPGFVYIEAMACGLPVIACSGSGIDEIITNGENGILIPPKNSHALAEALKSILTDKTLMEKLGRNARNYAVKEADSADCLKKLEAFYFSVLSKPGTNN